MAEVGIKIEVRGGVHFLSGELNEYSDFEGMKNATPPLILNMKGVERLNSIGIRNLLKFLNNWGSQPFVYQECRAEFIDQINMIPALLGVKNVGKVETLFAPFECDNCSFEEEVLGKAEDFEGDEPVRPCPKCGSEMIVVSDSFFIFRGR